ncbi:hypothetical protein ACIBJF_50745 [Streptomyces sp. NPDC050743]
MATAYVLLDLSVQIVGHAAQARLLAVTREDLGVPLVAAVQGRRAG